jgi:putative cell wall-binding protein
MRRLIVIGLALSMLMSFAAAVNARPADAVVPDPVVRLAGANRFDTAAQLSARGYADGAAVAYIATGRDFPDALAAGPAAGFEGGPLLLTEKSSLPGATAAEIARLAGLGLDRIVIVGGEGAVSAGVEAALGTYVTTVERVSGTNRYSTAANVSNAVFTDADTVVLAVGNNFPDALGAGPLAIKLGAPILLTDTAALPAETVAELAFQNPSDVIIVGGTAVVSQDVEDALILSGYNVIRLAGANRFETAKEISDFRNPAPADLYGVVYVAVGNNYPDALGSGPVANVDDAPLLLVNTDDIPQPTATELNRLQPSQIVIVGGTAVVSDAVAALLAGYVVTPPPA